MKPRNRLVEIANSSSGFWTCFLLEEGMMTTLLRKHPEQYLQKSLLFTRDSQYFRDVGPSCVVTKQLPLLPLLLLLPLLPLPLLLLRRRL